MLCRCNENTSYKCDAQLVKQACLGRQDGSIGIIMEACMENWGQKQLSLSQEVGILGVRAWFIFHPRRCKRGRRPDVHPHARAVYTWLVSINAGALIYINIALIILSTNELIYVLCDRCCISDVIEFPIGNAMSHISCHSLFCTFVNAGNA